MQHPGQRSRPPPLCARTSGLGSGGGRLYARLRGTTRPFGPAGPQSDPSQSEREFANDGVDESERLRHGDTIRSRIPRFQQCRAGVLLGVRIEASPGPRCAVASLGWSTLRRGWSIHAIAPARRRVRLLLLGSCGRIEDGCCFGSASDAVLNAQRGAVGLLAPDCLWIAGRMQRCQAPDENGACSPRQPSGLWQTRVLLW